MAYKPKKQPMYSREETPDKIIREVECMTVNRQVIDQYRGTAPNFYLGDAREEEIEAE